MWLRRHRGQSILILVWERPQALKDSSLYLNFENWRWEKYHGERVTTISMCQEAKGNSFFYWVNWLPCLRRVKHYSTDVYCVGNVVRTLKDLQNGQVISTVCGKHIPNFFTTPDFPLLLFSRCTGKYEWRWDVEKKINVSLFRFLLLFISHSKTKTIWSH